MTGNDSTLLSIVSAGATDSYDDVVERLGAIQAELDPADGLVWFNRLYAAMTAAVVASARRQPFLDPDFLERLDCHFADLYFVALAAHLRDPGTGPGCWEPLFQARSRPGVLPAQFAIAGVNAHINRDLSVALVTTFLELEGGPERAGSRYADYQRINRILENVQRDTRLWLFTGKLSDADVALGQLDDVLEMWSLERAREAAWIAGEVRWALRSSPSISRHHLDALDRLVGFAGRGLLCPLTRRL